MSEKIGLDDEGGFGDKSGTENLFGSPDEIFAPLPLITGGGEIGFGLEGEGYGSGTVGGLEGEGDGSGAGGGEGGFKVVILAILDIAEKLAALSLLFMAT